VVCLRVDAPGAAVPADQDTAAAERVAAEPASLGRQTRAGTASEDAPAPADRRAVGPGRAVQFSRLAACFARLEGAGGRGEMIAVLAELLGELGPGEVGPVIYLCQGRLAPSYEPLEIGMGERSVAAAIARAADAGPAEVAARYARLGDRGLGAHAPHGRLGRAASAPLTIGDVHGRLHRIATDAGPGSAERKLARLADLLRPVEPGAARYLCRIPLGRLRLGIGDPTILDARSQAGSGTRTHRAEMERAYKLTSDLGALAERYAAGGIGAVRATRVQVGKPIRPALAERLPSVEAVVARLGRRAAEPKYDGLRCQVHKHGHEVRIFSRSLENVTAMFPEIAEGIRAQVRSGTAILDGEAVAHDPASGRYLPLQATTRRRRRHGVAALAAALPLRLFVFDAMLLGGEDLTPLPNVERRRRLEAALTEGATLRIAPALVTDDAGVLRAFLLSSVENGLEGVVAKRLDAPYQAGGGASAGSS
jgi:DNA ligase-1